MDDTKKSRYLQQWRERARRDNWRNVVARLYIPAQDGGLDLLGDATAGHEWFRLPSYGDYLAACSCGWRSLNTPHLGRMLYQVKDHLRAARQAQMASATRRHAGTLSPAQAGPNDSKAALTFERAVSSLRVPRAEGEMTVRLKLTVLGLGGARLWACRVDSAGPSIFGTLQRWDWCCERGHGTPEEAAEHGSALAAKRLAKIATKVASPECFDPTAGR